ncbi:hypothetical protein [Nostoc sp.]
MNNLSLQEECSEAKRSQTTDVTIASFSNYWRCYRVAKEYAFLLRNMD